MNAAFIDQSALLPLLNSIVNALTHWWPQCEMWNINLTSLIKIITLSGCMLTCSQLKQNKDKGVCICVFRVWAVIDYHKLYWLVIQQALYKLWCCPSVLEPSVQYYHKDIFTKRATWNAWWSFQKQHVMAVARSNKMWAPFSASEHCHFWGRVLALPPPLREQLLGTALPAGPGSSAGCWAAGRGVSPHTTCHPCSSIVGSRGQERLRALAGRGLAARASLA